MYLLTFVSYNSPLAHLQCTSRLDAASSRSAHPPRPGTDLQYRLHAALLIRVRMGPPGTVPYGPRAGDQLAAAVPLRLPAPDVRPSDGSIRASQPASSTPPLTSAPTPSPIPHPLIPSSPAHPQHKPDRHPHAHLTSPHTPHRTAHPHRRAAAGRVRRTQSRNRRRGCTRTAVDVELGRARARTRRRARALGWEWEGSG
ncbi:hypothetical protein VTO73DRAFT_13864 [Trametes versicolor]